MKKRFILKVMYGDADGEEEFVHITEDKAEITFLTFFLHKYDKNLFYFYNRPDLLKYNKTFKNNEEELIKVINQMALLANDVLINESNFEKLVLLTDEAERDELHSLLSEIINFVGDWFDWYMYHSGMDYNGNPESYLIEDITGCAEITKEEAIKLLKEKLGMNVVFTN